MPDPQNDSGPGWMLIAGFACGAATLLYLMVLSVFVAEENRLMILALAVGMSLSTGFLGGHVLIEGKIPAPLLNRHPIAFSVSGGLATFVIVLVVASFAFLNNGPDNGPVIEDHVIVDIPDGWSVNDVINALTRPRVGYDVAYEEDCMSILDEPVRAGVMRAQNELILIGRLGRRLVTPIAGLSLSASINDYEGHYEIACVVQGNRQ